jgi:signal transduction histidine kinase
MLRERKLMSVLRERATREASLRSAAEALAAAFTLDDVAREIARTAVSVLPAHGAFVLQIQERLNDTPLLVVHSTAGSEVPLIGTTCRLAESAAEAAIRAERPITCTMHQADPLLHNVRMLKRTTFALVIPLHDGAVAKGALVVLSASGFDSDDMIWAGTFEHIATLAYEKVRLLDAANLGRLKLENVMDSRSRLMRGFTHDLKNPLGAADGYAALMLEGIYGQLTPLLQESLQRIRRSINVALALIEDLNDFARAEAGKVNLKITTVDVAALTQAIWAQYHASAHARNIDLEIDILPDLPHVKTDAARLRQIVSNLLSNAIKYTDRGSVRLHVTPATDPYNDLTNGVRIDVGDTGPGIPLPDQARIFDEFARLEDTRHPGAGLGLPISKLLAEMLGGSITVDSEVGVGSTFSLWIPEQPLSHREKHEPTHAI